MNLLSIVFISLSVATGCKFISEEESAVESVEYSTPSGSGPSASVKPKEVSSKAEKESNDSVANGSTAPKEYKPRQGDYLEKTRRSKSWTSASAEPSDWTDGPVEKNLVLAAYKDGSECSHRVRFSSGGVSTFADVGCSSIAQCELDADKVEQKCTTESAEEKDFGNDFKKAKGEKTICLSISGDETAKQLTKTTTYSWVHSKVLLKSFEVHQEIYQCVVSLVAGEGLNSIDPCQPGDEARSVSFLRSETTVNKQLKGNGKTKLESVAHAEFEMEHDFLKKKGGFLPATCTATEGKLSVTLSRLTCLDDNIVTEPSLTLVDLPLSDSLEVSSSIDGVSVAVDGSSFSNAAVGDCNIKISSDASKLMINGSLTCSNALKDPLDAASTLKVKSAGFSCYAPKEYESVEDEINKLERESSVANAKGEDQGVDAKGEGGSADGNLGTENPEEAEDTVTEAEENVEPTPPDPLPDDGQLVFISSFKTNGRPTFGGQTGRVAADMWCSKVALDAGLTGSFNAIMSLTNSSAMAHAVVVGKVYNMVGSMVATSAVDFWSGAHQATIAWDETKTSHAGDANVLTGAEVNGTHDRRAACRNWSRSSSRGSIGVRIGSGESMDQNWIHAVRASDCATTGRVYCLQVK